MKLFGFGKDGKTVEVSKDTVIDIGGKPRKLEECVNALAAADAAAATITAPAGTALKDEDVIEVDGKKRTVLEMKNALVAADKAKAPVIAPVLTPAEEPAKPVVFKSEAEFANAVDARVAEVIDKKVGEGFFNGIQALARTRPGMTAEAPKAHRSEKDRIEAGRKRFGRKSVASK